MGSYSEKTDLLEYLRSRSQVDCDSLDTDRIITSLLYLLSMCNTNAVLTSLCKTKLPKN